MALVLEASGGSEALLHVFGMAADAVNEVWGFQVAAADAEHGGEQREPGTNKQTIKTGKRAQKTQLRIERTN